MIQTNIWIYLYQKMIQTNIGIYSYKKWYKYDTNKYLYRKIFEYIRISEYSSHPVLELELSLLLKRMQIQSKRKFKIKTGATCISYSYKFGHLVAPLALPHCLCLPYWHHQLVLSCYLHQPQSRHLSLKKWSYQGYLGPIKKATAGSSEMIRLQGRVGLCVLWHFWKW